MQSGHPDNQDTTIIRTHYTNQWRWLRPISVLFRVEEQVTHSLPAQAVGCWYSNYTHGYVSKLRTANTSTIQLLYFQHFTVEPIRLGRPDLRTPLYIRQCLLSQIPTTTHEIRYVNTSLIRTLQSTIQTVYYPDTLTIRIAQYQDTSIYYQDTSLSPWCPD